MAIHATSFRLPLLATLLILFAFDAAQAQNWWQTNSLQTADTVDGLRYHVEGAFSMASTSGNMDSHLYQSAPAFFLRDGRFQLSVNGDLMLQRLKKGAMEVKNQQFDAYGRLIYDLSKSFQAEGGLQWEQDHSNYIDHRSTYYAGVIFNPVKQKTYSVKFFGGAGYQFLTSTEDLPLYPRTKEHEPVVYIQQMLTLTPTSKVSINQSFTYLNEFNDANTTRTVLTLKAQFPVTKYLSIVSTYTSKYQTQPTVPGAATISESRNATFTNGVKISF